MFGESIIDDPAGLCEDYCPNCGTVVANSVYGVDEVCPNCGEPIHWVHDENGDWIVEEKEQETRKQTMPKYISVKDIESAEMPCVSGKHPEKEYQTGWNDAIRSILENASSVDAVPVVRCKDCEHCTINGYCNLFMASILENSFCGYGRKRSIDPKTSARQRR